jgi:8-oxo-dGTP diphosphatase
VVGVTAGGKPAGRLVRAAGGVVWRRGGDDRPEVLLVHRPAYDDWTFPKGKREKGETDEACAVRELEEETGLRCRLGPELAEVAYVDRRGRPKRVRYWASTVVDGRFEPNQEVDLVRWLAVPDAAALLTYDRDQAVVEAFLQRVWSRRVHPSAHAGWTGGPTTGSEG